MTPADAERIRKHVCDTAGLCLALPKDTPDGEKSYAGKILAEIRRAVRQVGNRGPGYITGYGDEKLCTCRHPYRRHFDSYNNNRAVGCKYCPCDHYVEAEDQTDGDV